MWKVKRMTTARIVVLTTADGAGGIAAYLANRPDSRPLAAEPVRQPPAMDALAAQDEPFTADGADSMAAVLPGDMRVPSLTRILK